MFIVIVPAYNEEKTIGSVVRSLFGHADQVVVVDDGSSDRTAIEASAGAVVLRHEINRGQGAALETGHEYARRMGADYVLHFDGDGQFEPNDVPSALAALQQSGADVLLGSRFIEKSVISNQKSENGTNSGVPVFKRLFILPVARLFHRLCYGIRLTDAHNGFRILNRRALEHMRLTHDRMAHATEIVALAKRHHLRVIEFPVNVMYREYGQRVGDGVTVMKDLFVGELIKRGR